MSHSEKSDRSREAFPKERCWCVCIHVCEAGRGGPRACQSLSLVTVSVAYLLNVGLC